MDEKIKYILKIGIFVLVFSLVTINNPVRRFLFNFVTASLSSFRVADVIVSAKTRQKPLRTKSYTFDSFMK